MIQSFIHSTINKNFYLYDDQHRLSMLIHPELNKAYKKSKDTDPYYLKKYKYLKNNNFFEKPKLADFETEIDESMVKESIIQTGQIVFEATDFCNLKCSYCSFGELYEGFDMRNHKFINIQSAITLLKYIFDLNTKNKNRKLGISFYGGEPLINIGFIKRIVEVSKELNVEKELDLEYSMTTNATLIHKHIKFLIENKIRLMISLDGDEKNHSYRIFDKSKKNSFQKVIENIDMIQRDYPEYFFSYVNFNAVLHNRNSVKEIYNFISKRYNKIPRISELSLDDVKFDKKEVIDKMYHSKMKSENEYQMEDSNLLHHNGLILYKELVYFLKYFSINFYISNLTSLLRDEKKFLPTNTCLPFSKKIFLTNNNKLLPCEKINFKYSFGQVDQKVMIDIPVIVKKINFYYDHLKKVCQHCYVYRFCGLCMFQINNLDKLGSEEFICDQFHDKKAFQTKMNRVFSFLEKYPNDFSQILENVIIT